MVIGRAHVVRIGKLIRWISVAALGLSVVVFSRYSQAQTFQVIHTFTDGGDGSVPQVGLTPDSAGNFYGTAAGGGAQGCGVVFKLNHLGSNWTLNPIYSFENNSIDGCAPQSRAAFGPDGSLYGTTNSGGTEGGGTLYKLNPTTSICRSFSCPWSETLLHNFPDPLDTDGFYPTGDLTFDSTGNIYGTTTSGGSGSRYGCGGLGCGVAYELMRSQGSWTENILHEFTGQSDGANPSAGMVFDDRGNLNGSACGGGTNGYGLVFKLAPAGWQQTPLYDFHGFQDGICPSIVLADGYDVYGISENSDDYGRGALFHLTFDNLTWNFESLYEFSAANGSPVSLTRDGAGNFYGTTLGGGAFNYGSVFKLTFSGGSWIYSDLHDFTDGPDGASPVGQLVVDSAGRIFGTAERGGSGCQTYGCGVIFEVTPN